MLKGMKQDALATQLGISQAAVSKMEQSREISDVRLEEVAKAFGITSEAIRSFNEDASVNIIATTVNTHDQSALIFFNPTFNPIDKVIEIYEENKKLYERLLNSEREKNNLMEFQLKKK